MKPRLLDLGDTALTLELGDKVDLALNARVLAARDTLGTVPGITDIVPSYRSLTVHFDPAILERHELAGQLLRAAEATPQNSALVTRWRIPVLYGGTHGPDLIEVARATGRSEEAVVEAFCSLELRVFMIGFLPGFPYLGELPDWLQLPRRSTPRTAVPPQSVAIAGAQAAIYPWQSPGGWHLLGRTPVRMFDLAFPERPALLAVGDSVQFTQIDTAEFERLSAAADAGELSREKLLAP
ncbi:MAG: 5-oxoprolinase subunit PxpB [Sulfuritalea sp.]|nr:5-oxoprolinase subunit PxpB [Sulfuritalea sp.]